MKIPILSWAIAFAISFVFWFMLTVVVYNVSKSILGTTFCSVMSIIHGDMPARSKSAAMVTVK